MFIMIIENIIKLAVACFQHHAFNYRIELSILFYFLSKIKGLDNADNVAILIESGLYHLRSCVFLNLSIRLILALEGGGM